MNPIFIKIDIHSDPLKGFQHGMDDRSAGSKSVGRTQYLAPANMAERLREAGGVRSWRETRNRL